MQLLRTRFGSIGYEYLGTLTVVDLLFVLREFLVNVGSVDFSGIRNGREDRFDLSGLELSARRGDFF